MVTRLLVLLAFMLALGALGALAACSDARSTCFVDDYRACRCSEGARGFQRCDGKGWGPCDCSGNLPGIPFVVGKVDGGAPIATGDGGTSGYQAQK